MPNLVNHDLKKFINSFHFQITEKEAKMKLLGYILGLAGIGVLVAGLNFKTGLSALGFTLKQPYIIIAGAILIIAGLFFLFQGGSKKSSRRITQVEEEVPIYEGSGKKRKIVGYQRAK
jgi:sulfite exporter TauE/SafE